MTDNDKAQTTLPPNFVSNRSERMTAKLREPRLCQGTGCNKLIQNPKFNQRFCSPGCRPQIYREPIVCQGEGCGKLILKPRLYQRFCEPSHALSLATRNRQARNASEAEAQNWSEAREFEHELRERLFPCVTCGRSPRVEVFNRRNPIPQVSVKCCVSVCVEQGIEAAVSLWNRTPLPTPSTRRKR